VIGKLFFAVAGVFVGAFTVEYLRRKNPELLERMRRQATRLADQLFEPDAEDDVEPEPAHGEPEPAHVDG